MITRTNIVLFVTFDMMISKFNLTLADKTNFYFKYSFQYYELLILILYLIITILSKTISIVMTPSNIILSILSCLAIFHKLLQSSNLMFPFC
jgi:hypothetical protein